MKIKKIIKSSIFGRSVLSLGLLYGVYTETGIWTTLSILLTMIYVELAGREMERIHMMVDPTAWFLKRFKEKLAEKGKQSGNK